jgi:hypothetical protein
MLYHNTTQAMSQKYDRAMRVILLAISKDAEGEEDRYGQLIETVFQHG